MGAGVAPFLVYAVEADAVLLDQFQWMDLRVKVSVAAENALFDDEGLLRELYRSMCAQPVADSYLLAPRLVGPLRAFGLLPQPEGQRHAS
jgi:hypothetical protein